MAEENVRIRPLKEFKKGTIAAIASLCVSAIVAPLTLLSKGCDSSADTIDEPSAIQTELEKFPEWKKHSWRGVEAMEGYNDGDPNGWRWNHTELICDDRTPREFRVVGISMAKRLVFDDGSLKLPPSSLMPRTGDVLGNAHQSVYHRFRFYLRASDFAQLQIFETSTGNVTHTSWYRFDDCDAPDCQGVRVSEMNKHHRYH